MRISSHHITSHHITHHRILWPPTSSPAVSPSSYHSHVFLFLGLNSPAPHPNPGLKWFLSRVLTPPSLPTFPINSNPRHGAPSSAPSQSPPKPTATAAASAIRPPAADFPRCSASTSIPHPPPGRRRPPRPVRPLRPCRRDQAARLWMRRWTA